MKEKLLNEWNKLNKQLKLFICAVAIILIVAAIKGIF